MDHQLTEDIGRWLNTKAEKRDIALGAQYLLRLSRNRVRHANILANPSKFAAHVEHELQKFYNFRVQKLTHEQFVEKAKEAEKAVERQLSHTLEVETRFVGKRPDHEQLPDDIKRLYEEIPALRNRMREVHTRLRTVSDLSKSCLDSDAWPYVNELIELDSRIRSMWMAYDAAKIS